MLFVGSYSNFLFIFIIWLIWELGVRWVKDIVFFFFWIRFVVDMDGEVKLGLC